MNNLGIRASDLAFSPIAPPVPRQAYAKLHGTYESINGGSVGEALVDLTGGCCENISFTSGKYLNGSADLVSTSATENDFFVIGGTHAISVPFVGNFMILLALTLFVIHR